VNEDLKVTQVYENGPAEEEGLRRGDIVLMVDSVLSLQKPFLIV
jgi:C-terminal processing protease CtpA/Prc